MECGRISDQLGFYIDGVLDERGAEQVQRHLAECADCRAELASLRLLIGAASEIEAEDPPLGLRARIAAATTQSRNAKAYRPGLMLRLRNAVSPRSLAMAGGLACAVAAIGVFVTLDQPSKPVGRVAVKTLSPAPISTDIHSVASKQISVAVAPIATEPLRRVASAGVARRHRAAHNSGGVPQTVAAAPRTGTRENAKLAVEQRKNAIPDDAADEVAAIDDTTAAVTVAYEPTEQPAAETAKGSATKQRPALAKLASSPVLDKSQTEEWLKEMKTRASMRSRDRGANVVSVISARF